MKLLRYVIKTDTGFCPNPFFGYCTLAACTPNHVNATLEKGDWIIGHSTKGTGHKLIYAMQLTEQKMHYDEYFRDPRFESKKPKRNGSYEQKSGDNLYFLDGDEWRQIATDYHSDKPAHSQDTKYPFVFISEHFYYFGDVKENIPPEYKKILWERCGVIYKIEDHIRDGFLAWLESKHAPGRIGDPRDRQREHTSTRRRCS